MVKEIRHGLVDPLTTALFDSDLICTRITLGIAEFFWFVMLAWPGDTFVRPTYHIMSKLATEGIWTFIFAFSSLMQFYIAVYRCGERSWARVFATWNASLWILVVGSMLLSVYPPPAAVGGELALAFAALWIWARPLILANGGRYGTA